MDPLDTKDVTPLSTYARTPASLKMIGDYLKLSPSTVSLVVNNAPGAKNISERTRLRVLSAAKEFGYRPNLYARALQRKRRIFAVGVILPEMVDHYCASVMHGIEEALLKEGYLCSVGFHHQKPDLLEKIPRMLIERQVEGVILIGTPSTLAEKWNVPVVAVGGRVRVEDVCNVTLDQNITAELALRHLSELGHLKIALIHEAIDSAGASELWKCFRSAAADLNIQIEPSLDLALPPGDCLPELGFRAVSQLLDEKKHFTAVVASSDFIGIGAIAALREHGLRVPEDISVLVFGDTAAAAVHNPSLTSIRQPLYRLGQTAALTLLRMIKFDGSTEDSLLQLFPELIARQSTSTVATGR